MVPLVAAVVEEVCRLGIRAGHDDARNPHDVELEAGRVEALDLLVHADEDLATLVAALLGARPLILNVIASDPDLDESADEVPHGGVTAVARIGVGHDERSVIDRLRGAREVSRGQA